jgi:hypothetical protein
MGKKRRVFLRRSEYIYIIQRGKGKFREQSSSVMWVSLAISNGILVSDKPERFKSIDLLCRVFWILDSASWSLAFSLSITQGLRSLVFRRV